MNNTLLEKFKKGEKTVGTFAIMGNSESAECLGLAGLDYFIVDAEHGPFDVESTLTLIKGAELRNTTPLVRVKDASRSSILKMLDIGAKGLVIPNVKTVEEVKQIVDYGKYAPIGMRGVGAARGAGYGYDSNATNLVEYFQKCNEHTLLIPQCETVECLNAIEDIVAIDGVDGIFVGPFDLSVAMDKFAQFDHPEFQAALQRVLSACQKVGKPCFIFAVNAEAAKGLLEQGFDSVTINTDAAIFTAAYKNIVEKLK
ncbi:HpcH/HpaI aldolase family protein [Vibrio parahaemolyticus]|uniref:HpcH/HpaI aldolase family protein n=1 Tax=Vibrio mediterranei TaxID=689 RepID=UPI004068F839